MPRVPHARFVLFLVIVICVTTLTATFTTMEKARVLGFDTGVLAFLAASIALYRDNRHETAGARGAGDDGGRGWLLVISVLVLGVVLLALGRIVLGRAKLDPADFLWVAGTLVLAWLFVNLVYAYHYAHLYYRRAAGQQAGGLNFPGEDTPIFADFCYFSFVIGMTCQVSDVVIESRSMRRVAMLHGLLAFFFNLGVLALTINVLSGVL